MSMQSSNSLEIVAVPAFADNYIWLIHNGRQAVVVDPGDAAPVLAALAARGLALLAILLTHHHADHVGGVPGLLAHFPVPVHGPRREQISTMDHPLAEGDQVRFPELGLDLQVLDVPGHTAGHIAYVAPEPGWLFCGDTLFAGGCGRLFEGTPAQMVNSLGKLAALPGNTAVYCAHEYTLSNLQFALEVEADNQALQARYKADSEKRQRGQPTVPSTIALETATNPFLRYTEPAIIAKLFSAKHVSSTEPITCFAALREWKNIFR